MTKRFLAWRWSTFLTLLLGYVGYYLCRANLSAAMPLLKEELAADLVTLGLIGTVPKVVYGVAKFPLGFLSDIFGGRALFLTGLVGAVVFSGLCGFATGAWSLIFLWSLNRLVQAGGWTGMVQISAQWFPKRQLGRAMGGLSQSWLVGDWAGRTLAAAVVAAGLGWRWVFFVPALGVAIFAIAAFFTLKPSPEAVGEPALSEAEAGPARGQKFDWADALALVKRRQFQILLGLSVLLTAIREATVDWCSLHFTTVGLDLAGAMEASTLVPIAGSAGTLLVGWLSDRVWSGRRAPVCVLSIGILTLGLAGLAMIPQPTVLQAKILWAVCGFGLLGPFGLLGGAFSIDVGGRRSAAIAAGVVDGLGYVVGAILGGVGFAAVVRDQGWPTAFGILAVFSLLAMGATWFLGRAEARGA